MEFAGLPGLPTDVGETQEVERLRLPFSTLFSVCNCVAPELDQSRLVRVQLFYGSIPCLHVPLSTLHVQPCDCPRMTRGQVGSLRLTCTTLAFATLRRFIPAHSNLAHNNARIP